MYLATSSAGRFWRALMHVSKASLSAWPSGSDDANAPDSTPSRRAFSSSSEGTMSASLAASMTMREPVSFT